MKAIAIIPARGGSKRIPRKNVREFLGRPVIAWSIAAALESGLFAEVMVSTDDQEIADIGIKAGAQVPFMRSAENSDDFADTARVLIEVLQKYAGDARTFQLGCCLYPASPFVTVARLKESLTLLETKELDCVFPVVQFSAPIQRALYVDASGVVRMFFPENRLARSQDLEPAYHDAGQFYWFRSETLLQSKSLWTERSGAIVLSELEAQDIDTEADWRAAEIKFRALNPS